MSSQRAFAFFAVNFATFATKNQDAESAKFTAKRAKQI